MRKKSFKERITQEELYSLYWEEGRTAKDIGELYNVGQTPVLKFMNELGIARRESGREKVIEFLSKAELTTLYIYEGKSTKNIAELYDVHESHVRILMKRYKIGARASGKQPLESNISSEEMSRLYWEENKTLKEIALHLNVGTDTVLNFMKRNNIPRRTRREKFETLITKKELKQLYCEDEKTTIEIGTIYNVSTNSVLNLLKKWGIKTRKLTKVDKLKNIYKDKPIILLEDKVTRKELYNLYWEERKTLKDIGKIYSVHWGTVTKLMDNWGIPKRKTSESHAPLRDRISKEDLEYLYIKQKKSANEISKLIGASNKGIDNLLNYYEISKRSQQESCQMYYDENTNFNVDFFKKDSSKFFYILGLLLTDGMIQDNERVSIGLTDLEVIKWIAGTIELKTNIHRSVRKSNVVAGRELKQPPKPIYRISFLNKEVSPILKGYGLKPNKTHTLEFPNMPNEFIPDFLRGVLDGDGSISVSKYKNKNSIGYKYAISYASASINFITMIKVAIENLIGGERKIMQMTNGVYIYSINAQWDVYQFAKLLYNGDAFGMSRKKERLLPLLESPPKKPLRFIITKEVFEDLYTVQKKSIAEIANMYELETKNVYHLLYTYGYKQR